MSGQNVLLVVLDSVRARNCSLYGHENETTPFLSRFADDAILFEQARAPSIHSVSSHASIWTGHPVEEHGITEHKSFVEPPETVWRRLAVDHSHETGLFSPNVIVTRTSNLGDVFDTCAGPKRAQFRLFDDGLAPLDVQGDLSTREYVKEALAHDAPFRSILNGFYKKFESRGGAHDPETERASVYVTEFLDWLDARDGPWAACLNFMDAHTPFAPKPEYDRWSDEPAQEARRREVSDDTPESFTRAYWDHLAALEPLYDGSIRQADAAVERLVGSLADRGCLRDTLVVVTADHGEGFGEQSALDQRVRLRHHSWGIDEALTHVPLVVRPPGEPDGRTVVEPVTLTRFPAVVEGVLDGGDPADLFVPDGDVVSSTYRIEPPGNELNLPRSERSKYFGPWRAVYRRTGDTVMKYARRDDRSATFAVPDAQTTVRRSDNDSGVVESVFSRFEKAGIELGSAVERDMDDSVETRLEDLGYLR